MTDQVTPRPWEVTDGHFIDSPIGNGMLQEVAFCGDCQEGSREANARHIVKCVNNHDRLVEALREVSELDQMSMENAIAWLEDNCQDLRTLLSEIEGGE